MQLRHVGIVVKNLHATLDFYEKWFGCQIVRKMEEGGDFISSILGQSDVIVDTYKLEFLDGKGQLEVLNFKNPPLKNTNFSLFNKGITHIAIKVNNLESLYNSMKKAGVNFISEPLISVDKMATVCFCRDPNGVFLELVEIKEKL